MAIFAAPATRGRMSTALVLYVTLFATVLLQEEAAPIAGVAAFAREFDTAYAPAAAISLAPGRLPLYTAYSLARGVAALACSYAL